MKAFKVVIIAAGLFIVATGLLEVVLGPAALPGNESATPSADSNYRFFAVSWLALGLVLLSAVPKVREAKLVVRGVSAVVFAGGIARLISLVAAGTPHPMIFGLLGVELVVPPLLVGWHNRLIRD
ncbi:DUF4345 domain-containing protein [Lentzea tibetensis]|uniref:DUF4345 domain-containing protein n=1 Tax=Lentzea tibetensis TaxID=2591470 RepID=A0A563EKC4_9PSEU|nr:DUF4345 domain-containing protein [Lentzea tibetensis]TWP47491.1 DUF4345 domain-containing protein [Lentzea tibetensis]